MTNAELEDYVSRVWDVFRSGGITNRLEAIEQITYLLLLRWLDDPTTLRKGAGRPQDDLRWTRLREATPNEPYDIVRQRLIPTVAKPRRSRVELRAAVPDGCPVHHP